MVGVANYLLKGIVTLQVEGNNVPLMQAEGLKRERNNLPLFEPYKVTRGSILSFLPSARGVMRGQESPLFEKILVFFKKVDGGRQLVSEKPSQEEARSRWEHAPKESDAPVPSAIEDHLEGPIME